MSKINTHTKTPLTLTETPVNAFGIVIVDTVGPLPKWENGNENILTYLLYSRIWNRIKVRNMLQLLLRVLNMGIWILRP